MKQCFKDMNKLELSANIKMGPTFHVSLLKPFEKDTSWPDHKHVIRPPPNLRKCHLKYEVQGYDENMPLR